MRCRSVSLRGVLLVVLVSGMARWAGVHLSIQSHAGQWGQSEDCFGVSPVGYGEAFHLDFVGGMLLGMCWGRVWLWLEAHLESGVMLHDCMGRGIVFLKEVPGQLWLWLGGMPFLGEIGFGGGGRSIKIHKEVDKGGREDDRREELCVWGVCATGWLVSGVEGTNHILGV